MFGPKPLSETVAELSSGEEIVAKSPNNQSAKLDPEWTFHLNHSQFRLISAQDKNAIPSIQMAVGFSVSDAKHNDCNTEVVLTTYYASHHGSILNWWEISFDVKSMVAVVNHREVIDTDP